MISKKQKLQKKLTDINAKYEIIINIIDNEQLEYEKRMRKHDLKLRICSSAIRKLREEISNLEQLEKENKYSVEEIESAKSLLEDCGYTIVKI